MSLPQPANAIGGALPKARPALVEPRWPTAPAPTESLLLDIVERIASRRDLWEPLVAASSAGCATARLRVPEGIELQVATWGTFDGLRLRSYAKSTVVFRVVSGVLTEVRPDAAGRLLPRRFAPGVSGVIRPGEVHDLRNEQVAATVAIQAYSHRLAAMRSFDWTGAAARQPHLLTDLPGWLGT